MLIDHRTKEEAIAAICDELAIPRLHATVGSSVPRALFDAMCEPFGVSSSGSMPAVGRRIADAAGLHWAPGFYSTGSTVTLEGLNVLHRAVILLKGVESTPVVPTSEDMRDRVQAQIVRRRGQPRFREALMKAYGARCAITGTAEEAVLEAAHIEPYMGDHSNAVSNGLLLRSDVHTLFDVHLLSVDPATLNVWVNPNTPDDDYRALSGHPLRMPTPERLSPSAAALEKHFTMALSRAQ